MGGIGWALFMGGLAREIETPTAIVGITRAMERAAGLGAMVVDVAMAGFAAVEDTHPIRHASQFPLAVVFSERIGTVVAGELGRIVGGVEMVGNDVHFFVGDFQTG